MDNKRIRGLFTRECDGTGAAEAWRNLASLARVCRCRPKTWPPSPRHASFMAHHPLAIRHIQDYYQYGNSNNTAFDRIKLARSLIFPKLFKSSDFRPDTYSNCSMNDSENNYHSYIVCYRFNESTRFIETGDK